MDLSEVRKTVGKIQANLFKNSNSFSIGMLKSHFRGTGLQFKEHQIYSHGDDVRFIDWKLLAKTNNPYIKTFEEERNVEIVVIIDCGISMLNGNEGISKLQAAIEIASLLYLLAKETGDKVHVILFTDKIVNIPKASGEQGLVRLVSTLEKSNILLSNGKVNIFYQPESKREDRNKSFNSIMKHIRKNRELVILSDFNDFFSGSQLKKLVFNKNVHPFRLVSPVDEMDNTPFQMPIYDINQNQQFYGSINSMKDDADQHDLKNIKKIRMKERYLESFIKEML